MAQRSLRWWLVPGVGGILWLLQWLRNTLEPFAEATLSLDGDIALHMLLGDLMLERGGLLPTEPTCYLVDGRPFIAHEWLSQIGFALSARAFGLAGPVMITAAVVATLSWWMFRRAHRGAGVWPALLTVVAAMMVQNTHLLARPHLFTWLLAFAFTTLCEDFRAGRSDWKGWLAWSAPLVLLWAQLHGGFLAMAPILLAFTVGSGLEALADPRWRGGLDRTAGFALGGAGLLLLTGLNPWGFSLHGHFLAWLASDYMTDFTTEFRPPDLTASAGLLLLGYTGLAFLGLAGAKRPPASHLLMVLGFLVLAFHSARHAALFATLTAPFVAGWLQEGLDGLRGRHAPLGRLADELQASSDRLGEAEAGAGGWGTVAVFVALTVATLGVARTPSLDFRPDVMPVAAVDWLEEHPDAVGERMFNPFNWGAYLSWRLHPEQRVFINSWHDHLGEAAMRTYFTVHEQEPGWRDVLEEHGVDWVIFDTRAPLARTLDADEGWTLAYRDATASIWTRADVGAGSDAEPATTD